MKKLMFVAAVAAGMVAFGDAIESANVVGYTTKEAPKATFRLAAISFEGASDGSLNLNDLVNPGVAKVAADGGEAFLATAPQIQVQQADGNYITYYYISDAMYISGFDGNDDPIVETKAGWADMFGILATPEYYEAELADGPGVAPAAYGFWAKGVSKAFTMTFKTPVK